MKSLRARVVATALIAVAAAGASLVAAIALFIGPVMKDAQLSQLKEVLQQALSLDGFVNPEQLAQQITRPGVSVVISRDGREFSDGKPQGSFALLKKSDDFLTIEAQLPISGSHITLVTANSEGMGTFKQIMRIGLPALLLVMLVLGLVLWRAMKSALKPLDNMTNLATKIASGDRGGRLDLVADEHTSELGRTAAAFNNMLDSLETSLARAQAAESRLRQLCADVAHELRSPLASIVAAADNLVRNGGKKAEIEQAAIGMVREGQRASRIVGDLTLVSQLDVDDLASQQISQKEINVVPLVAAAVAEFAKRSPYELELVADPKLTKQTMMGDPERITQILNNLLENANRWTEKKILVRTGVTDGYYWAQILDDGPGVPEAERENIFERFVRLEPDRARSSGGSGLGLAISRSLAEAHGGTLRCLPTDKGALFELRLPI